MKKVLAFLAVVVLAVSFFGTVACKKPAAVDEPTPMPTNLPTPTGVVALIDDMEDGNNRMNSGLADFSGGYWFTFDDLASPNNGTSILWPQTETAVIKFGYNNYQGQCPVPVATFQMSAPNVQGSIACARISGLVRDNTSVPAGFQYGFVGFGVDLNEATPNATPVASTTPCTPDTKVTEDLVSLGYTKLHFIAKNGPSVTGTKSWKVKMVSNYGGYTDACDVPVKVFTTSDTWQAYDMTLSTFAPEGWCASSPCACGVTTAQFMSAVIGFQWQTNYRPGAADIMIDDVYLVK